MKKMYYVGLFSGWLVVTSMAAYAVKPIYPAEIMGRDLMTPGLGWVGHVGVSTAPDVKQDAHHVIEVLRGETPIIQINSIASFKSKSSYWGSRYGIADRGQHASRILQEATFQKDLFCATYTATPNYTPGRGYYDDTGHAIPTSCGYFRCDTFVNHVFHAGGYPLPTYNPSGPDVVVSTLPRLVFKAFPYLNSQENSLDAASVEQNQARLSLQTIDFTSSEAFIMMPFEQFVSIVDAATHDKLYSQYFLSLAQDQKLDTQKRQYLLDVLGFVGDVSSIAELVNIYHQEHDVAIKTQVLATLQNIRQRLLEPEHYDLEKNKLHSFYASILESKLLPDEREMALRGYIALSTQDEILSNQLKLNQPGLYADMHPRIALGLKLELLHQNTDLEDVLIPDILSFLSLHNDVALEEVFHVYLVNRLMHAGLNSFKPSSKTQIKNYLNAIKYKYRPDISKKMGENLSILSRGAWLEAFVLTGATSMDEAKADMLRFLGAMDVSYHEEYTRGVSKVLMSTAHTEQVEGR
ncbi:MAG: hypothetical protein P1U39_03080 [Legionellaceae bacterium]|nr:hypothetical protein [Legionellaceae bacterium]